MENLHTIGKIFRDRIFCVPDYQRGYAWGQRQCQDFVEDLELLGKDQEHFMGLLILLPNSDGSSKVLSQKGQSYHVYDVVDGQQRLTTCVLFLDAIRKEMEQFEDLRMLASGIEETYVSLHDLNGQLRPKLRLNRDTHAFFHNVILERGDDIEGPKIRSHHLLLGAKVHFAGYLEQRRQQVRDYAGWLKDQYLKITQQLTLVVYTVDSEADAGVVFETMNNRGKELTELEKVKNYLLYLASKLDLPAEHNLEHQINSTWTHIFEHLMAAELGSLRNEDQLLRAHWLMAYDYDRRRWDGSRSVKDRFNLRAYEKRHPALLEDLTAYLASLRNAAIAYCDVFNPRHPNAFGNLQKDKALRARIMSWGVRLVRLDAPVTFLPLLMAVRIRFPDDGQAYLEALRLCEKFAFRVYRWMEVRAYTGQSWMFRLGHQLFKGRNLESTLGEVRNGILRYASDRAFANGFEREDVDWYRWRGLKYMLYEYEQHLAEQAGQAVRIPWEQLESRKEDTIEHILPQTMDPGGYWAQRFTPEEHERYVHDIGNLTLTYDNSALGNKPFPAKRGSPDRPGCYASSKLFVEQQLARHDDWTEAEILARREEIGKWAMARWHVDRVEVPAADGDEDAVELARRVLCRRFIPRGQLLLYKVLYEAGETGVPYEELAKRMGIRAEQFSGVMGALGNRINRTEGLRSQSLATAFLLRWDVIDGVGSYFMRPQLRAAIESLPKLRDVLASWSIEQIHRKYSDDWYRVRGAQRAELRLPDIG